ncbi:aminopeptidase [Ectobacillus ponti]|uniref:Aminopeptidase n=1 Tax=Ectobacillus ponti TaxID=2961894 RepID=A0AA41X9T4_9BACI|nr:aminopeptidase [Ectobacillus ponti]MCP8968041.1 aminopeptidase [Ectobacillus ponti]
MTFQQHLEKYAALAVEVGLNVQPGQTVFISSPIAAVELTRLAVKRAYEVGAKQVYVDWSDDIVTRLKYDLAPDDAFLQFPSWVVHMRDTLVEEGAAFLSIVASNPDLLKGVDSARIASFNKTAGQALSGFRTAIQSNKVSWTVIAAPSPEWAAKVFPDQPAEQQVESLWNAIFAATRATLDNPVQAWKEHNAALESKVQYLNSKRYQALHYTAPGTDLTIELPKQHVWVGGGGATASGTPFVANIPTEEVFTMPLKTGVNGYVSSTKPLNYSGNLIENFKLTFENGRIVAYTAETGEETLKTLVETDEGSHYLGEVALVPHQSPISDTNIIFYNTLFDENASAHLAIGSAYAFNLEGGTAMSKEELEQNGANTSLTHVDFMIGSAEMNIDGVKEDGTREPLFRNGNWAV